MYIIKMIVDNKNYYYTGGIDLPIIHNVNNYSPKIEKAMKFKLKRDAKIFCKGNDIIVKIQLISSIQYIIIYV